MLKKIAINPSETLNTLQDFDLLPMNGYLINKFFILNKTFDIVNSFAIVYLFNESGDLIPRFKSNIDITQQFISQNSHFILDQLGWNDFVKHVDIFLYPLDFVYQNMQVFLYKNIIYGFSNLISPILFIQIDNNYMYSLSQKDINPLINNTKLQASLTVKKQEFTNYFNSLRLLKAL